MRLLNRTTQIIIAKRASIARTPWAQLIGWMGQVPPPDSALGLPRCQQIHTLFVPVPLDLAFCDTAGTVLRIVPGLMPFRVSPRVPLTGIVWEMAAPNLTRCVSVGDTLVAEG